MPRKLDFDDSLFADLPEWADVTPVEQYEGVNPVAPIFYTPEYTDATNYFRAIVQSGEKSERVLDLTENIIRQNPAHYSAWQYRYETLVSLLPTPTPSSHPLLTAEVELMDELAVLFLKTYQVWHHRRLLVQITREPQRELDFIKKGLQVDSKNYHTWSYRQWILGFFGGKGSISKEGDEEIDEDLWASELDFVDTLLATDVRNNSAWHHRFFVVWACGVREGEEDRERVLKRELIYAKQAISLAPSNPSAWNYLRGILAHTNTPFSSLVTFAEAYAYPRESVDAKQRDIVDLENPLPSESADLPCAEAMEFLADAWEVEGGQEKIDAAVTMWTALANERDVMRKKYWEHRIRDAHLGLRGGQKKTTTA
ncbi:Protein farnesyltransferase/geranylgeranyltransferase type-1 subunit alpha [Psilocybe cubensis]|uniref:Protein farnesyltransferase/geranylgeranyltransferase type-1 subunit alpha n=2 Tax=Psilocybe cubensis TaxID=181762 RepID=A0A8H7XUF0_PSICU|nr:Protein farnesyltransferase/geranylgeranyltransferase type-1 subunit alpha [Psilocybe cubensis]KAH9474730.1 Protein farnesyltransferase/geranylgeranyltransferase type-1 subunit alpha [Psilocybe cubensis]